VRGKEREVEREREREREGGKREFFNNRQQLDHLSL
jgi:hypothetical protein